MSLNSDTSSINLSMKSISLTNNEKSKENDKNRSTSVGLFGEDINFDGHTNNNGENINLMYSNTQKLQDRLDAVIAADCIYCGNIMVQSIDKPFISKRDGRSPAAESWKI